MVNWLLSLVVFQIPLDLMWRKIVKMHTNVADETMTTSLHDKREVLCYWHDIDNEYQIPVWLRDNDYILETPDANILV